MNKALKWDHNVNRIVRDINLEGGRVFATGDCVRNGYYFEPAQSTELFIFDLNKEDVETIFNLYGTYTTQQSTLRLSFLNDHEFTVITDQSPEDFFRDDALKRRFTIDTAVYDLLNDRYIMSDQCQTDLDEKVLRVVDEDSFKKDLYNIFETAKLIAELELTATEETVALCREMMSAHQFNELDREYVYAVYSMILMTPQPSLGFEFMRQINALPDYLYDLTNCLQRLDYHPEGNVWNHTMMVIDEGAWLKRSATDPLSFMWACLLHDIGKPLVTTPEGRARLHAEVGAIIFDKKVDLITDPDQRKYVEWMIYYHMELMWLSYDSANDHIYRRFLKAIDGTVPLDDLVLIGQADKLGRGRDNREQIRVFNEYMRNMIARFGKTPEPALVTADDLREAGLNDEEAYQEILDVAFEYQIEGMNKEEIIRRLVRESEVYYN